MLRLVFSRQCLLSGAGCLVGIADDTSVYVAHLAIPAGKLWFLGKSRSNPLFIVERVCCRFCLACENVDFRGLLCNGEFLGVDDPCKPHG